MNNLLRTMPVIIEENGGTEKVAFQKPPSSYKVTNWDQVFQTMEIIQGTPIYSIKQLDPVFLLIHGAGFAAMTYALLAKEISKFASCVSYDLLQHGLNEKMEELSIENLLKEGNLVLDYTLERFPQSTIILVGHSLGGAIAAKLKEHKRVLGLILLESVEQKALSNIENMECMLRQRPQQFNSIQHAVNYHLYSALIRNPTSASITVPYYINQKLEWKIDLLNCSHLWKDWFVGMQKSFEEFKGQKMMVLADYDRMNNDAYKQCKFPIHVMSNSGHSVHEDEPLKLAKYFNAFIFAQRIPINEEEMNQLQIQGIFNFRPKIKEYLIPLY